LVVRFGATKKSTEGNVVEKKGSYDGAKDKGLGGTLDSHWIWNSTCKKTVGTNRAGRKQREDHGFQGNN